MLIRAVGYQQTEQLITATDTKEFYLQPQSLLVNEVVITASRIAEKSLESPITIEQLDQQARRFINSASYNTLAPDHARLSSLFRFYVAEFGDGAQLIAFVNRYARVQLSLLAQLEFMPFDWALNDRQRLAESQAVIR